MYEAKPVVCRRIGKALVRVGQWPHRNSRAGLIALTWNGWIIYSTTLVANIFMEKVVTVIRATIDSENKPLNLSRWKVVDEEVSPGA
jgi:hypothetical protein